MFELKEQLVEVNPTDVEGRFRVKVLTEEGDVFDITDVVWSPTNQTYYLKVVLAED